MLPVREEREREREVLKKPRRRSSFADLAAGFVVGELRDLEFGLGTLQDIWEVSV